jgi:hypothetical protein
MWSIMKIRLITCVVIFANKRNITDLSESRRAEKSWDSRSKAIGGLEFLKKCALCVPKFCCEIRGLWGSGLLIRSRTFLWSSTFFAAMARAGRHAENVRD